MGAKDLYQWANDRDTDLQLAPSILRSKLRFDLRLEEAGNADLRPKW
jgi:hypothetical protein